MSRSDLPFADVVSFLWKNDFYAILTHDKPDGDTVGSAYALAFLLREMGKKAGLFYNPKVGPKLQPYFDELPVNFSMEQATVIAVDIADDKLLFPEAKELKDQIKLVIDHHYNNRVENGLHIVDETAAATCELIYRLSEELNIPLPQKAAQGIYLGLMTDTGCFKYSNVTPDTLRIASKALAYGAQGSVLSREWFIKKSRDRMKMEAEIISGLSYYENGQIAIGVITRKRMNELGVSEEEINGMASLTILAEGCEIGILIKETEDHRSKVSVRTDLVVDASELCAVFGGGGHKRAAGCSMDCLPEEAAKRLLEEAIQYL